MRCAHITPEGIADLESRGFRVRRCRSGGYTFSAIPDTPARNRARWYWSRVPPALAEAWDAYAEEANRRAGKPTYPGAGRDAFLRKVGAQLARDLHGAFDAEPPKRFTRKGSRRKAEVAPTMPFPKEEES